jgi:hypothetical protein
VAQQRHAGPPIRTCPWSTRAILLLGPDYLSDSGVVVKTDRASITSDTVHIDGSYHIIIWALILAKVMGQALELGKRDPRLAFASARKRLATCTSALKPLLSKTHKCGSISSRKIVRDTKPVPAGMGGPSGRSRERYQGTSALPTNVSESNPSNSSEVAGSCRIPAWESSNP